MFESQKENQTLRAQVEQERQKNKKLINDFDAMTSVLEKGESEQKAISDSGMQAMVVKT